MNIQQHIISGIREQLYFNNFLVLPGFGGFVLRSYPAHFSASGGQLVPPSKTVSFNVQLKQNDGIMVQWLQKQLNCDSAQALGYLKDFSDYCTSLLQAKRRLTLQDIGFFYLDFENNICFEPQGDTNFLTESFGLSAVSLNEIPSPVQEIRRTQGFEDRVADTPVQPEIKNRRKNYSKPLAFLGLGMLLFTALLFVVSNTHLGGQLQSSLSGGGTSNEYTFLAYSPLNLKDADLNDHTYVADANGIASYEVREGVHIAVKVLNTPGATPLPASNNLKKENRFEVVVGCFTVLENANKMVKKLRGKTAGVAVTGKNAKGMFVVGKLFNTREEALKNLETVKTVVPSAWIKKAD